MHLDIMSIEVWLEHPKNAFNDIEWLDNDGGNGE